MVSKFERDLKKELNKIKKTFESTIDANDMRKLGKFSVEMIHKRTKLGYGVANFYEGDKNSINQKKKRLKPLSPAYVKFRQRMKKAGKLDSSTTVKKSNLTLTGQMLKNLGISSVKAGSVVLKTKGRRTDSRYTNEQIAEFVSDQGRPWLDLTDLEQKKLARYYQNNILKPALAKI